MISFVSFYNRGGTMRRLASLGIVFALLLALSCADKTTALVDDLKFLLDQEKFDDAATKADANMPDASDTSAEALEVRRLASEAYLGKSKMKLLDIASDVADFGDDGHDNDFFQFACIIGALSDSRFDSLRTAIKILTDLGDGVLKAKGNEALAYQAGVFELIEAFGYSLAVGSDLTETVEEGTAVTPCSESKFSVSTATLAHITDKDRVESSFVLADDHLKAAGLASDNVILEVVREAYCRLKVQNSGTGFRLVDLQAQVLCQLVSGNPDTTVLSADAPNCLAFTGLGANKSDIDSCVKTNDTTL